MEDINTQLVLISGESSSGKSASLRNIPNQDRWMFLNCEAGKRLPFKNKFKNANVTDPYQVHASIQHAIENPAHWDGAIIDTVTFLMDMFESTYIIGAADTMKGWSAYQQFFKTLMQDKVVNFNKPVIILGHTKTELDEGAMMMRTQVPVKGALKNNGIEAYFSTVVSTKRVPITTLVNYENDLLNLSDEDKDLGFKHVFQTRITKETVGERIRSPMGLFTKEQTYMDNDCQLLLEHLRKFYA